MSTDMQVAGLLHLLCDKERKWYTEWFTAGDEVRDVRKWPFTTSELRATFLWAMKQVMAGRRIGEEDVQPKPGAYMEGLNAEKEIAQKGHEKGEGGAGSRSVKDKEKGGEKKSSFED